jgi:twitching motility protein PilT
MSAIVSLLRVMTLRDAEAIVLEPGKVPTLRRRGNVEALAMPPLEPELLAAFAEPLLAGKSLDDGPLMVTFTDAGTMYPVTVEQTSAGLRIVVRRPAPMKKPEVSSRQERQEEPDQSRSRSSSSPPSSSSLGAPGVLGGQTSYASSSAQRGGLVGRSSSLGPLIADAVRIAHQRGASDVFVSTGQGARIKLDGRLETIDVHVDDAELAAVVGELAGGDSVDLSLELDGVRLRVNAFAHLGGAAVAARLIREHVPPLGELGLPAELAAIVEHRDGLVVVCGPTGSGKSTTLASLIDLLDQKRAAHVITLEDPIEYRFAARRCLVHQRELGTHMATFAAGLKAALREAPDVILLGELRDRETIAAALTAAETGHLVVATLHAPSAIGAIDRLIDAFPENQQRQVRSQLAACLRTVVTQYLLPRRDGGRAAAIELVPVTPAVANIIRKGELQTLPTAIQSGREAGMIPLERSLARLVESGAVAPAVIKKVAADHDLLSSLAGKLR